MLRLIRILLLICFVPFASFAQSSAKTDIFSPEAQSFVRYVCPMHSHIVKDHAGTCPICGMDLVARSTRPAQTVEVEVTGAMQQAMALKTELVARSNLWRFISTYGSVQFDETGLTHLHPRATGWIENLTVNSLGQRVKKGELLYEIYAPDLLIAQEDFLSLLSSSNQSPALLERGRSRLRLLGLDDDLIKRLEQSREVFYRVPYFAKADGIVSALAVREGMYIQLNDRIMTLADLSRVWVIADVFEHQIDWVSLGKAVELDLPALDLYGLEGSVDFIYPTLDPVTRTLKVRLGLANPEERLKPDMLANVRIYAGPVDVVNIPVDALIQTEKHNRVFVKQDDGLFQRRDVEVGIVTNGRAEIISGLQIGERVVSAGQFLLDAEASLSNIAVEQGSEEPQSHAHH
jgi:Cu(I)/Ag(I) efflux system membrane fusion protein